MNFYSNFLSQVSFQYLCFDQKIRLEHVLTCFTICPLILFPIHSLLKFHSDILLWSKVTTADMFKKYALQTFPPSNILPLIFSLFEWEISKKLKLRIDVDLYVDLQICIFQIHSRYKNTWSLFTIILISFQTPD